MCAKCHGKHKGCREHREGQLPQCGQVKEGFLEVVPPEMSVKGQREVGGGK